MQLSQVQTIMNAVRSLEIKSYAFLDDINTRYYNNEKATVIVDESNEMIWNIRKTLPTENYGNTESIILIGNDITDIRRFQIMGDSKLIRDFVDQLGLTLSDDEIKKILTLNITNKEVMPLTGDYSNIFHYVYKETYDAMTEEEKEEYDAHVKKEEERFALPKGTAAQINVPR